MEQRIFGLLPVVDHMGFLLDGVASLDVTGFNRDGHGDIDAPDCIPGGSVVADGRYKLQSISARG